MTDCAIRLKAKPAITEAERSGRLAALAAIYRLILECADRIQNQTAKEPMPEDPKTAIPKKDGAR